MDVSDGKTYILLVDSFLGLGLTFVLVFPLNEVHQSFNSSSYSCINYFTIYCFDIGVILARLWGFNLLKFDHVSFN